jgi:sugar lactone lactonase YvrE
MRDLAQVLVDKGRRDRRWGAVWAAALAIAVASLAGCAPRPATRGGPAETGGGTAAPGSAQAVPQTGSVPVRLDFLYALENDRNAPYYPIEGIGAVMYGRDGTLYFCDEKGGRVHGIAAGSGDWLPFDEPPDHPFRPVDIRLDGFMVLVLDMGSRLLLRYDVNGVYQDRLVNFDGLGGVSDRLPSAFDVDLDGRIVCTDAGEQQILVLDNLLTLTQTIGGPGSHEEQLQDPSGIVFRRDGGFVVADRGNRRLQWYNRLGYFEGVIGGEFDTHNPLLTPQGLEEDGYGNLFVADPAAGKVHVYDSRLKLLFSLGSELGLLASPESPLDVAVGPDDLLAVADRGRSAILVYRIVYA